MPKVPHSGEMVERVDFFTTATAGNDEGDALENKTGLLLAAIPARVTPLAGDLLWVDGQVQPTASWEIAVRWHPSLLTPMQCRCRGRLLNVIEVRESVRREFVYVYCKERADGTANQG